MKLQEEYLKIAKAFIGPYKKNKNIIGITLSGGISRGTGDISSEIDITFYVKNKKDISLPPRIPGIGGDVNVNGVWFDFKISSYDKERKKEWVMVDRWDGKTSKILFDNENKIKNLLKDKCVWRKGEKKELRNEREFIGFWSIALAKKFSERGDLKHAHMLVNHSLDAFIDEFFVLNNEFIPYFKWKHYFFQKLKKPNKKVRDKIFEAYQIKNYSDKELRKRIGLVINWVIKSGLKKEPDCEPYKQDLKALKNFENSLKRGVEYTNPWPDIR